MTFILFAAVLLPLGWALTVLWRRGGLKPEIWRDTMYAQAANCLLMIQVGHTCFVWGAGAGGYAARLELFTPVHWFRYRGRVPEKTRPRQAVGQLVDGKAYRAAHGPESDGPGSDPEKVRAMRFVAPDCSSLTGGNLCPNRLCNRSEVERYYDEAECEMPTCPFYEAAPIDEATEESSLAKAVKKARGGEAPRPFRGRA